MERGEIWWAEMGEPRGSEPGFRRPVVIISSNDFNKSNIQTVIVAVITSNLHLAKAPCNFKLSKKSSGLPQESVVNVSQILTLDKSYLTEAVGNLNNKLINALNDGVKLTLNL